MTSQFTEPAFPEPSADNDVGDALPAVGAQKPADDIRQSRRSQASHGDKRIQRAPNPAHDYPQDRHRLTKTPAVPGIDDLPET